MVLLVKNLPADVGDISDVGLISGSGRSSGGGNGNPLQYSCLETPMDGGAWWATVHSITESDTTEVTESYGQYHKKESYSFLGIEIGDVSV